MAATVTFIVVAVLILVGIDSSQAQEVCNNEENRLLSSIKASLEGSLPKVIDMLTAVENRFKQSAAQDNQFLELLSLHASETETRFQAKKTQELQLKVTELEKDINELRQMLQNVGAGKALDTMQRDQAFTTQKTRSVHLKSMDEMQKTLDQNLVPNEDEESSVFSGGCRSPFEPVAGMCLYLHTEEALPWHKAENLCMAVGGRLLTLANTESLNRWTLMQDLDSALQGLQTSSRSDVSSIWLGGADLDGDGEITWLTGESVIGDFSRAKNMCLSLQLRNNELFGMPCATLSYPACEQRFQN